jgi:hypothetical protein
VRMKDARGVGAGTGPGSIRGAYLTQEGLVRDGSVPRGPLRGYCVIKCMRGPICSRAGPL